MNRYAQLVLTGVVSAEVAGWLVLGSLFHFISVALSPRFAILVATSIFASVGALTGSLIWVTTRRFRSHTN
jgi:hypothetical protein